LLKTKQGAHEFSSDGQAVKRENVIVMHRVTSYPSIDLISARCFTIQFFTHPFDTTSRVLTVDKSLLEFLITKNWHKSILLFS